MSDEEDLAGFGTPQTEAAPAPVPAPAQLPEPEPKTTPVSAAPSMAPEVGEYLLGLPITDYQAREIKMIRETLEEYAQIVSVSPSSKIYVEEVARCVVELERHHAKIHQTRKRMRPQQAAKDVEILIEMDKERQLLVKRYTAALDAIGALPKDMLQQSASDDSLSSVHLRYREEIERLKAEGRSPGSLSPAAAALAKSVGLDPKRYGRDDVIPWDDREKEIGAAHDDE